MKTVFTITGLPVFLTLLGAGCGGSPEHAGPPIYSEKEKPIVRAAERAVMQYENWVDRAEFKLQHRDGIWYVTAWRVEHPEARGNLRYVPWGRREMTIDNAGKVLSYANDK